MVYIVPRKRRALEMQLYTDCGGQWEIYIHAKEYRRARIQAGALFERIVYDNFIGGPRCSAVVFNVLSHRWTPLPSRPLPRGLGFYFNYNQRVIPGRLDRFIKVVWHICFTILWPLTVVRVSRMALSIYIILLTSDALFRLGITLAHFRPLA